MPSSTSINSPTGKKIAPTRAIYGVAFSSTLCHTHDMDRDNNQVNDVENIHGKAKNAVNQGFYEALNVVAVVEIPQSASSGSSRESRFQKGIKHPVHLSKSIPQKTKEGLISTEPFLNLTIPKQLSKGVHIENTNKGGIYSGETRMASAAFQRTAPVGGQIVQRTGRQTVIAQFTIVNLREILPEVVPGQKIDSNREVKADKCEGLRDYFIKNPEEWILPPIIVDTELELEFKTQGELIMDNPPLLGLSQVKPLAIGVGICYIPMRETNPLIILDGQHRVCGLVMALNQAEASRASILEEMNLLDAQEVDVFQQGRRKELAARLTAAENILYRCATETITVEIKTQVPIALHKNYFVTIADNATGINKSERARLDQINMSSIVAKHIVGLHPLLNGEIGNRSPKDNRVDDRNNQAKKGSATIYSLDNIRNVVKNLAWSAAVKESPRRERSMKDQAVVEEGIKFFEILCTEVDAFKNLLPSSATKFTGKEFRKESLYASPTMLRCLAGAYHNLALKVIDDPDPKTDGGTTLKVDADGILKFTTLIRKLNPYMNFKMDEAGNLDVDPLWRTTKLFRESGLAPQSGFQDLNTLVALLTDWGKSGEVFAGTAYEAIMKKGAE